MKTHPVSLEQLAMPHVQTNYSQLNSVKYHVENFSRYKSFETFSYLVNKFGELVECFLRPKTETYLKLTDLAVLAFSSPLENRLEKQITVYPKRNDGKVGLTKSVKVLKLVSYAAVA